MSSENPTAADNQQGSLKSIMSERDLGEFLREEYARFEARITDKSWPGDKSVFQAQQALLLRIAKSQGLDLAQTPIDPVDPSETIRQEP